MRKLWMLAAANIKKTKSVSVTLVVMFIVAALLLNAGLLVTLNYGSFFDKLKTDLKTSDAYIMLPGAMYTEAVNQYIDQNEHIKQIQRNDALLIGASIYSQGSDKDFTVLFQNMDEKKDISKWKYVGEHLPPEDMSVYVPDIFKAVSGYKLGDKIKLNYTAADGTEKSLTFTVKGYTEDVYFSSTDTGMMGFYLPAGTYQKVAGILSDPIYKEHLVFANVDSVDNVSGIENGIRDILGLNSASMITSDASSLLVMLDIDLVTLSRCVMASMISMMLVAFSLIIVVVCLLVVRFRIVNSIEDDMMKIGSLKSVGYTSRQIIWSILMQFGLLAGIGSLIGIALSYPVLPAVSAVFEQQSGLKWQQGFDGAVSASAFFIVLLIIAAVSLLAARRVGRLSAVDALRGESSAHKYKRNHLPLDKAAGGLPFALAIKSVLQGMKQTVMIFIIVAAVAFAGAYGVIMYYNTSVDTTAFAEVPGMEICNVVANLNPQADQARTVSEIKAMDHVRKAQYFDEVKLEVNDTDVTSYVMADYATKATNLVYEGRYPKKQGEITLAGILAGRLHKTVGDTVDLRFGENEETFTVVGLSNGSQMGGMNTSILTSDFQRLNPDFKPQSLFIYLDKGTDADALCKTLESRFDKTIVQGTVNFDKGMAEGMASYQSIVAAMGLAMLVVTLVVIALVLYFVIGSTVIRRKKELGIQKAIGFTTLQLMNQIAIDFAIPVLLGVIIGGLLGAFYTNPMMSIIMRGAGIMKANFIVNPLWVTAFSAATFLFAYLLSLAVTRRIRKISAYALVTE